MSIMIFNRQNVNLEFTEREKKEYLPVFASVLLPLIPELYNFVW